MGVGIVAIRINLYRSADTPTLIEYRTGATSGECETNAWQIYNGTSFISQGWVQIRLTG